MFGLKRLLGGGVRAQLDLTIVVAHNLQRVRCIVWIVSCEFLVLEARGRSSLLMYFMNI